MKFSGLQKHYEDWCVGNLERIENKQRISLSSYAYNILVNDFYVFHPQEASLAKEGEFPSFFINNIFSRFKNNAHSSIAQAIQNQKTLYDHMLQALENEQARRSAIELLLASFSQKLKEDQLRRCAQKSYTFAIRINAENLQYLRSSEGQAEAPAYQDKIGAYVKAVLEEYCEHAYVEREQIYFKALLDEMYLAISHKYLLKLVLRSKNPLSKTQENNIMYVKPFCVQQNAERLYTYLVGMTSSTREGPWQMGSVRLTSIADCKRQEHPISISGEKRKEIEAAIQEKGVEYLSDDQGIQRIVVRFTSYGEKMFRSILHLRPQLEKKLDANTYTFACSLRQADNYFFKFGHHAKIIEPPELTETFRKRYELAHTEYTR